MKKSASILLFLFVLFLITPTVVSAIENDSDVSVTSSFSEEEVSQKDIKLLFYAEPLATPIDGSKLKNVLITSDQILGHDEILLAIFIPPPELL